MEAETPPRPSALLRLIRYARCHRRQVWLAVACSVTNKFWDLAPPALIGAAVDTVVKKEDSWLAGWGLPDPRDQLIALGVLTVLIWGLESIFEYAYKVLWRNLAQRLQHELRLDAYAHAQKLELSQLEKRSTGDWMAVLNDDINQLERFLDDGANELLQVATTVVVIGAAYVGISPVLALLSFLPVPLVLWGSFLFQRRIAPRYARVREDVGRLNALLANNLGGIAVIKSFTAEDREIERVRAASLVYAESNRAAIRLSSAFSPLIRMAIVIGFTATLIVGGGQAMDGTLAVGAYSVLVFLTQRLLWPLTRLGSTFDLYQRAMASTHRILDVLDLPVGLADGPVGRPPAEVVGRFELRDVDFGYDPRAPLFAKLSLEIPAGQTTAIVGATGAGKSSLIKLLLRFYEVDGGAITLDGLDLRQWSKDALRRSIGLVSQDIFLFEASVRENIAYGAPGPVDDAAVEAAARAAEAHEFIAGLPDGYDTFVGERGQRLSGGQRQRVALARVMLKNPPILILDEATSAVDNETEAAIQHSIEALAADRTMILIAHRLSTVRRADRIYVLEEGRVSEVGSHEDLIAAGGIYAGLWSVQTGAV